MADNCCQRVTDLEALLDNYRGTCQDCGRAGVLLDYSSDYDGMREVCLQDREGCERLHSERLRREGEEHRARVAAGDPLAVMVDNFSRTMLNLSRKQVKFTPGSRIEWDVQPATYAPFITSNVGDDREG